MSDFSLFLDLAKEVQPPDKGILSRTLFNDDRLKAVLFGFAQGDTSCAACGQPSPKGRLIHPVPISRAQVPQLLAGPGTRV